MTAPADDLSGHTICYSGEADPRHCAVCGKEMLTLNVTNSSVPASFMTKLSYNITFSNESGIMGTLDFNGPEMVFTGNAEESAKVFFDWIAKSFAGRLEEERQKANAAIKTPATDDLLARLEKAAATQTHISYSQYGEIAALISTQAARIVRLEKALEDAAQALYNSFEPDNQSRAYHEAHRVLKGEE